MRGCTDARPSPSADVLEEDGTPRAGGTAGHPAMRRRTDTEKRRAARGTEGGRRAGRAQVSWGPEGSGRARFGPQSPAWVPSPPRPDPARPGAAGPPPACPCPGRRGAGPGPLPVRVTHSAGEGKRRAGGGGSSESGSAGQGLAVLALPFAARGTRGGPERWGR